ncbi:MAG: PIG-L family deacetylase [Promethearchaeota archaeon]|nr:MAG: PIG-L family deacetylase [Candidatus Lokiarchaeota archaeon]
MYCYLQSGAPMRVLFLCAHADDSEFCCGNTEAQLAKSSQVTIVCMTNDEYGTTRNDFKGKRIAHIRQREMRCAARLLDVKLDWLNFIDGYLPFNRRSYNILKKYIEDVKPDIIFAPEPLFTLDFHTDHVNTGKLIYLLLKQMKRPPLLFFFHSFKPNYYVPCVERTKSLQTLSCHVSQGMDRKLTHIGQRIYQFLYGIFRPSYVFAEGYRLVRFKAGESHFSFVRWLLYWFVKSWNNLTLPGRDHYTPTPKELGLI